VSDFANLVDGGRRLGPPLRAALSDQPDPLLLAAIPNGVPVAIGILETLTIPVRALEVDRSDEGATVQPMADLAGRCVVVIDDGVETGTVAIAAAAALRDSHVGRLVLAVPVCPRDALAHLHLTYDLVVAVAKPMGRRSLTWHYADFDTIDKPEALRLLAALPPAREEPPA
jgi:predicted phosphoribosyltransferase